MNEQAYILSAFDKLCIRFAGKRIAIYGVGANTKYVLEHAADLSGIVGLMDAQRSGETIYGYPVYSAAEAVGAVDVIVIMARVAVVHLIYERIKYLADSGIEIHDVSGENLADKYAASGGEWETNPYWNSSLAELKAAIDAHSVISFDIFDTLLMRKVLAPGDVFRLTERAYEETFGKCVAFANRRADVERKLNESGPATIEDIYASLELDEPDRQWLREKEFETERRVLTPRTDVVECFKYAVESGKRVVIVSDMYYGADALGAILYSNGISGHEDLIVSCEHGRTKETGELFAVLLDKYGGDVLHIGDKLHADIEPARALGMDAYHVMSAQDMLLDSALYELLLDVPTLDDSLMLGTFAAAVLNSPFALCKGKGRLTIDTLDTIANFFTPMLQCFMQWLIALSSRRADDSIIMFLARDGYLVKELYDFVRAEFGLKLADDIYVLSSRSALSDEYAPWHGNYLRYLEKMGLFVYKNIMAYDFVTKGTSLRGLERLTKREIELVCFATFNIANAGGGGYAMFGEHNFYNLPLNFLKYYELLEMLSAPRQTQFLYFDDELNAVFADEDSERGKRWDDVAHIQKCIKDAFSLLSLLDGRWYAREPCITTADRIFGLISTKYATASDEVKRAFVFESHSENVEPTEWWDRLVD